MLGFTNGRRQTANEGGGGCTGRRLLSVAQYVLFLYHLSLGSQTALSYPLSVYLHTPYALFTHPFDTLHFYHSMVQTL